MSGYVRGAFGAIANGTPIDNADGADLVVSGSFVGTIVLQVAMPDAAGADTWVATSAGLTAPGIISQASVNGRKWRAACTAWTSGSIVYELSGGRKTTQRGTA